MFDAVAALGALHHRHCLQHINRGARCHPHIFNARFSSWVSRTPEIKRIVEIIDDFGSIRFLAFHETSL